MRIGAGPIVLKPESRRFEFLAFDCQKEGRAVTLKLHEHVFQAVFVIHSILDLIQVVSNRPKECVSIITQVIKIIQNTIPVFIAGNQIG